MSTVNVSDSTFEKQVLNSDIPVLVDFWAEWCMPCKALAPVLEAVAEKMAGKITIAKVNVDENPETSQKYRILGLPMLSIFKGGELIATKVGLMNETQLSEWVDEYL